MTNDWNNRTLLKRRKTLIDNGYEEFTGCIQCVDEKCVKEHRGYTMNWPIMPKRKCETHPRFLVCRSLLTPREMVEVKAEP